MLERELSETEIRKESKSTAPTGQESAGCRQESMQDGQNAEHLLISKGSSGHRGNREELLSLRESTEIVHQREIKIDLIKDACRDRRHNLVVKRLHLLGALNEGLRCLKVRLLNNDR